MSTETYKLVGDLNGVDENMCTQLWVTGKRTKAKFATANLKEIYSRDITLLGRTGVTTE